MKINKKGFLLYELFIAFGFIIVIMIAMLQTTLNVKEQQLVTTTDNEIKSFKQQIYDTLGADMKRYEANSVGYLKLLCQTTFPVGDKNIDIVYKALQAGGTPIPKTLALDSPTATETKSIVTYDGNKMVLNSTKAKLLDIEVTADNFESRYLYRLKFVFNDSKYNFIILNHTSVPTMASDIRIIDLNAGNSDAALNSSNWLKNIARDATNGVQVVYNKDPDHAYNINSADSGCTWSAGNLLYTAPTSPITVDLVSPTILVDGNGKTHTFITQAGYDHYSMAHFYKNSGGNWVGPYYLGRVYSADLQEFFGLSMPDVDINNNVHIVYDFAHHQGIAYRSFSNTSLTWSAAIQARPANYDTYYHKNIAVGNDIYDFYSTPVCTGAMGQLGTCQWEDPPLVSAIDKLGMVKRVSDSWNMTSYSPDQYLTSFRSSIHDFVVDKAASPNIWFFVLEGAANQKIRYNKMNIATGAWTSATAALPILDSEVNTTLANPSVTVTGDGKIYVFYSIYNLNGDSKWEIFFKFYDPNTLTWSSRQRLTTSSIHGSATYPLVRYQHNHFNSPSKIELTFRQGSAFPYKLYFASIDE